MMEDPERIHNEYRRRMTLGIAIVMVAILVGIIGIPLLKGNPYSLPVILITLAVTIPTMAFSFWIVRRLGGFDVTLYAEMRKRLGETRWQWYRRIYTAAPRRRPIYRMYIVIGAVFISLSFINLLDNRWQFIGSFLVGSGFLLMGSAEYQPYNERRRAIIMRIAAAAILLLAMPFLWVGIFHL
jgi:hypothetical protein